MKPLPYGRQDISEDDIRAVIEVLRSDWITQGPTNERFEAEMSRYCGAGYAVSACNATAALHLACRVLELGPGDTLWTSPNTFVASANCALYCGAGVDFVDIDPRTYNISVEALEIKLESARRTGKLPKVLVPVHFAGQPCDMLRIRELSKQYGFSIVEDAAHAVGAAYRGDKIGSCRYSDITVFSFHPVKIITTGEGGMLTTNRSDLHEKLMLLRSHGITRDKSRFMGEENGGWYYEQIDLGYNYRMTDIQAALGVSQLRRLDDFIMRRRQLVARYNEMLSGLPVITPWHHPDGDSANHLYVVKLDSERTGKSRNEVYNALRNEGIQVNVHYIPVHTQPYYRKLGFKHGDFPVAEEYCAKAISLPMYSSLSVEDQDRVVSAVHKCLT